MADESELDKAVSIMPPDNPGSAGFRRADTVDLWAETGLTKPARDDKTKLRAEWAVRLRRARVAADLTQKELSERTGLTQPAVARLESASDTRMPTLLSLHRYLKGCGAELDIVSSFEKTVIGSGPVAAAPDTDTSLDPEVVAALEAGFREVRFRPLSGFSEEVDRGPYDPNQDRETDKILFGKFSGSDVRIFNEISLELAKAIKKDGTA